MTIAQTYKSLITFLLLCFLALMIVASASAQTISLQLMNEAGTNDTASTTVTLSTDQNMSVQGFSLGLVFNPNQVEVTGIEYQLGQVSAGIGDDNSSLNKINKAGALHIQGESSSVDGATIPSASSTKLVKLTYKKKITADNPFSIEANSGKFYKINSDGSLAVMQPTNDTTSSLNETGTGVAQPSGSNKKPVLFIEWLINFIQSIFTGK